LSIGAYAGAHDGQSPVERKIAEIVSRSAGGEGIPCAVVVAAGNAGADDGHFSGELRGGGRLRFEWRLDPRGSAQKKLEIWYRSPAPINVELSLANASDVTGLPVLLEPGRTIPIDLPGSRSGVAEHTPLARGALSRVRILIHPPYLPALLSRPPGEIAFEIRCSAPDIAARPVPLHAWIEREDDPAERPTLYPSCPASTLTTLASAEGAIVVAGYDHHQAPRPAVFPRSSLGPSPWGAADRLPAPTVAAPAGRIWGAWSKTTDFIETSGTGAAAALTAGAVALLMQRAAFQGRQFDSRRAAAMLAAGSSPAWNPRLGDGPLNISPHFEGAVL
jgi:hypothetical protein